MTYRKLPPLHALAAFESVARHLSFSKAAQELFLTHSAVSQRIRLLETILSTQLLTRSNRSVRLTVAGRRYLETVRDALSKLQLASDGFQKSESRTLRLSVAIGFACHWLIHRLGEFRTLYPNVALHFHCSNDLVDVAAGEADIGIRWGRGRWSGLEHVRLLRDEMFPVCSRTYLKTIGGITKPADLQKAFLIRQVFDPWQPWFAAAGIDAPEPVPVLQFNDSALMLQAAAEGMGVALARRILVEHMLDEGRLVRLFDISLRTDGAFYVVYTKETLSRPEVSAFVDWIVAAAADQAFGRHP